MMMRTIKLLKYVRRKIGYFENRSNFREENRFIDKSNCIRMALISITMEILLKLKLIKNRTLYLNQFHLTFRVNNWIEISQIRLQNRREHLSKLTKSKKAMKANQKSETDKSRFRSNKKRMMLCFQRLRIPSK